MTRTHQSFDTYLLPNKQDRRSRTTPLSLSYDHTCALIVRATATASCSLHLSILHGPGARLRDERLGEPRPRWGRPSFFVFLLVLVFCFCKFGYFLKKSYYFLSFISDFNFVFSLSFYSPSVQPYEIYTCSMSVLFFYHVSNVICG
jgi:hypothetical protein